MDDLISRQAALEMLNDNELERQADDVFDGDLHRYKRAAQRIIAQLPSAEKRGKWIHGRETAREMIGDCITAIFYEDWKCSDCGYTVEDGKPVWNYCPNCGARMEGSEE